MNQGTITSDNNEQLEQLLGDLARINAAVIGVLVGRLGKRTFAELLARFGLDMLHLGNQLYGEVYVEVGKRLDERQPSVNPVESIWKDLDLSEEKQNTKVDEIVNSKLNKKIKTRSCK